ncbi:M24 family metallopeptidase [Entomospira entomophila]|uniref:M24 family metallopeptidase n=1 Tax=Entomospira entomophila TaxID=2719988 RepID=A0A968GCL8_9SPIO|nr:M24 family metallopeptidase [Entomospira entomophilus]NIZ40479.1 M24 family metallopeptidase [Entomospira entomophilus]WDI36037.1 M24 family metallopeptidase [Entomospira entomophilus]
MSLKVGLLATSELYEEGLRKRVVGITSSAKILMQIFDALEPLITIGVTPIYLKTQAQGFACRLGVFLAPEQISFCRFGQVHPSITEYLEEPLEPGEAFTLDIWLQHQSYHADLARIYTLAPYRRELLHLKRSALSIQEAAVRSIRAGERLLSVVQAAQQAATKAGVYIVEGACGHGIGQRLHEHPEIAFCYNAGAPFSRFKAGSIITVEPLIALKPVSLTIHDDGRVTLPSEVPFVYAEAMVYIGEKQTTVIGR